MADADGITALGAVHLSAAIRGRAVSCAEVMRAYCDRIQRLNPTYNAIVALRDEADLLREAAAADAALARGEPVGPLHGFPLAVKDLDPVRGLPFTTVELADAIVALATGDDPTTPAALTAKGGIA